MRHAKCVIAAICTCLLYLPLPGLAGEHRHSDISGLYVASTQFGNIFCLDLEQHGERVTGTFDEVDFRQVVPLQGTYRDGLLAFGVRFLVNGRTLDLQMQARMLQESPRVLHGHYRIGSERGNFILYAIHTRPAVCRDLRQR